jgi:nicotinamide-nucleotide amidase
VSQTVDKQLLNKTSERLKILHATIATAESCTGGMLASLLTDIPGSSDYFDRGVITYSNQSKTDLLNVPTTTLKDHGAVSEQTARAMATGIRTHATTTYGVATTGIAGPGGGTPTKPVGLIYIAVATPETVVVRRFQFTGDRLSNKDSACTEALILLNELLPLRCSRADD